MEDTDMMDVGGDITVDVEGDIDFEVDPITQAEAEQAMRIDNANQTPETGSGFVLNQTATLDLFDPVPEKVNLRGVNQFDPDDPANYTNEHFPEGASHFIKAEWINDESVNLVYHNAEAATHALLAFTSNEIANPSELPPNSLRNAKPSASKPASVLSVRQANTGDVKQKGAHNASKYYLWNPKHDRHEQRNRRHDDRGRNGRFRDNRRRDEEENHQTWSESMYDDPPAEPRNNGRRGSTYSDDNGHRRRRGGGRRRRRRSGDLFEGRELNHGRLRGRSASPDPDGDGRMGFDEEESSRIRRRTRQRSFSPPRRRRTPVNAPRELFGGPKIERRELFGDRKNDNAPRELFGNRAESNAPRELFGGQDNVGLLSDQNAGMRRPREGFPHRTDISNHRRTDAKDETPRKNSLFSRITRDGEPLHKPSLESRISRGGEESTFGRLKDFDDGGTSPRRDLASRITRDDEDIGMSIRGQGDPGMNIRGQGDSGMSIRGVAELSGEKRELFGMKIKGRGAQRKTAADMFG